MTSLEILVEEPSMEAALREIMPRILQDRARWKPINMGSKGKLLKALPARLRAYRKRIDKGEDLKIIALVDRDSDNCEQLKHRLETIAREAGLITKTAVNGQGDFQVVTRIAIEELEAWFMGDIDALKSAFSSLKSVNFPGNFRNPDNGGTWERLHRFLKRHGIYRKSYPKIEAARKIASHMDPGRNRSPSFQSFLQGVEACL